MDRSPAPPADTLDESHDDLGRRSAVSQACCERTTKVQVSGYHLPDRCAFIPPPHRRTGTSTLGRIGRRSPLQSLAPNSSDSACQVGVTYRLEYMPIYDR